jgi:hypothetical protein
MTPNIAQGGNAAIESAAALSNSLKGLLSNAAYKQPSFEEVTRALRSFQKIREVRAKATLEVSNKMTRVEALKGFPERIFALYVSPYTGDWMGNLAAHSSIGAEKLEYLPDTERSFRATMPFNRNYGVGHEENHLYRAMTALPILGMGYLCHVAMSSVASQDGVMSQFGSALANGKLDFGSAKTYTLLPNYYGGLTWLDNIWRIPIIAFSPSILNIDPIQRLQMISFLVDLAPLYLIWVLESHRRTNIMTFARFPVLFGIAFQLFGIGCIGPLYYFLHYAQSPISQFLAADMRLINVGYARTALMTISIAYLAPTIAMYFGPSASTRLSINALWQMFPIWVTLTHWVFTKFLVNDPTRSARLHNPTADLLSVRIAVITFIVISTLAFNWIRFTSPVPLSTVLSPTFSFLCASYSSIMNRSSDLDFVSGMAMLLKVDYLSCFIASYAWLALLFYDLKAAEMITETWARLAAYAIVGTFVAGPGAVVGGAWLWREEILASKKAAGAVVRS